MEIDYSPAPVDNLNPINNSCTGKSPAKYRAWKKPIEKVEIEETVCKPVEAKWLGDFKMEVPQPINFKSSE